MEIQNNISLKPYNTFGIDVQAKYFASFSSVSELEEAINYKPDLLRQGKKQSPEIIPLVGLTERFQLPGF